MILKIIEGMLANLLLHNIYFHKEFIDKEDKGENKPHYWILRKIIKSVM